MWIVLKYDKKKFHLLKEDFKKKIGDDYVIYRPQILVQKYKNKKVINKKLDILGNYLFCFHRNFKKKSNINQLRFCRGLKYFLDGFVESQSEIKNFVQKCRDLEDSKGFIAQTLFELKINSKYIFSSGAFIGRIFKIINLQKNKMNILIGDIKTTINKKEFLFNPI